ncbi:LPS export ABC transporter permease LptF [Desulfuromonas thiophila]|uniref:Lipopolysaccharide export system permease protein n=1 Tax=Desulfuromonas thiophila TaxID=57664 RepID=A0A1G7AS80_9BACT|nr:LPS export ABC transporter permease LptF [Desulfuromonas thiophila]SDE16845.1 lipopolysaccharide export system permease protein [Desulfuromonas thiophila]
MRNLRIHRYLLRELLTSLMLGLGLFTLVILLGRLLKLMELVVDSPITLTALLSLFGSLMPSFLVITLPLAFLLAVLLLFGRLSGDSELVAFQAAGIGLWRLSSGVLLTSLVVALLTGGLTLYAEPAGQAHLQRQLQQLALEGVTLSLKAQHFSQPLAGLTLYADQVDRASGQLSGIFISDARSGRQPLVVLARRGLLHSDSSSGHLLLHLEQGVLHRSDAERYQLLRFARYDIDLSLRQPATDSDAESVDVRYQNLPQLLARLPQLPPEKQRSWRAELHERLSLALCPPAFALLGIALAVRNQRSSRSGGFTLALLIFLLYYLSLSAAKTLALEKNWPLLASLWAPNLLFYLAGGLLFGRVCRERPLLGRWRRPRSLTPPPARKPAP